MSTEKPTLEEFRVDEFDLKRKAAEGQEIEEGAAEADYAPVNLEELDSATIARVIEMGWEDRTTFEVIEEQFGLKEKDVIAIMRRYMKRSSFKMWRKRVTSRKTKHAKKRDFEVGRFKSSNQRHY